MSGIHHNNVDPRLHQGAHAIRRLCTGAHRCAHQQAAIRIFSGIGVAARFFDVTHGDHAGQLLTFYNENLLNAVFLKLLLDLFQRSALWGSDQLVTRCHHVGHARVHIALEAHIAAGHNAHQPAAIEHRETRKSRFLSQRGEFS